ncbi:hypothetical protein RYX36_035396 [Vicia faba]
MEHYALSLQCSSILSPFSYASKSYENKKIHVRFNQTTLCFPQCTINHNLTRSISHANCMSSNSFSVPNSKNIETSDNNILRGINGVSIVLGCILGMFNFNSKMMNSKFNNAYAINPNVESFSGGERSFNSLWNSMNAELIESEIKFNSPPTVDNKKKHALYLRKCGKKDKVEEKLNELKSEYIKSKDEYSAIERSVRLSLMELLLIQGHFDEARKFLDEEIDILVNPKRRKIDLEKKISKLLDIYNNKSDEIEAHHDKQAIADIIFYKAIIHIMLKDKEAAKWWEAFAKTLTKEPLTKETHFPWSI